jgi:hypothetical protein
MSDLQIALQHTAPPLPLTPNELAIRELLIDAEKAHKVYECLTGKDEPDWPSWYARFIAKELDENRARCSS